MNSKTTLPILRFFKWLFFWNSWDRTHRYFVFFERACKIESIHTDGKHKQNKWRSLYSLRIQTMQDCSIEHIHAMTLYWCYASLASDLTLIMETRQHECHNFRLIFYTRVVSPIQLAGNQHSSTPLMTLRLSQQEPSIIGWK